MAVAAEAFVGREAEAELLAASLEAASDGQPRFVLVTGEVGIGKTRLLREAATLAAPFGLRVLTGTAIESGVAMPYLPLLSPLAACLEDDGEPAAAVRRLVTGEPLPGRGDAAGGARLVESVFAVLSRKPTLLVVDDVHWADASTVAVLDYLSHRARSEPLAVVVAARDDEPDRLARLPIADGRRYLPLPLRRLTAEEVAEHLAALLGRLPEPELVSTVFERSAGNPFFVEQLVAETTGSAPASLRTLLLHRLAELPERTRQTVDALAVIGRPADETLVAAVAALGEQDAEAALREATGRGITVSREDGFAFRHPLFSEVVVAELAGSTRRRLHRRVAEALAAGGDAAEQATHWWEAGDAERAWAAALEAAEAAERTFAFPEARLHLERALEVWPEGVAGRVDCLLRAADAAWLAGDAAAALALARRALEEGPADGPGLHLALGSYAWDAGEPEVSTASFERAAALVQEDTPAEMRSRALWALARAHIGERRYADALAAAEEAAATARGASDRVAEARALFTVGSVRAWQGSLAGIADVERGLVLAVEAESPVAIGHGYHFLASLVQLTGDLERALEVSLEGVDACERVGLARSFASDLRAQAALALIERARWDEADAVLDRAEPRALPLLARALLAMRRGHLDKAERDLERAALAPPRGGPSALGGELDLARAELAWLGGNASGARAALAQLAEFPGVWGAAAGAARARLAARLGADAPEAHHPDARLDAAFWAEIAAEQARPPDPALWAACAVAWGDARRPYDETYARVREAEALFAVDARDAAKEVLRQAASAASALGAAPLRALAEDLARRARVSPDRPRPREPDRDEPTPRELDVLALLADGLTNREIAARLFLSPKTVGIHVSRLLRKLDAHTRGEAVAVARRRGLLA